MNLHFLPNPDYEAMVAPVINEIAYLRVRDRQNYQLKCRVEREPVSFGRRSSANDHDAARSMW